MSRRMMLAGSPADEIVIPDPIPGDGGDPDPDSTTSDGYTVRPYSETVDASTVALPTTYLAYGDTGISGSSTHLPWNSTSFAVSGLIGTVKPSTPPSVANTLPAGSSLGIAPFVVEFAINNAARFTIQVTNFDGPYPRRAINVSIDGHPITDDPINLQSSAVRVVLPDSANHRVRIEISDLWFGGIDIPAGATVTPLTARSPKLMVLGDSWVAGESYGPGGENGDNPDIVHMAFLTAKILDAPVWINGIGGTGYNQGAPATSFGGDTRLPTIIAAEPDVLLLFGSINDNGQNVSAAASALYASLATALPELRIVVCGPQSYNNASNATGINHDSLAGAAEAAPNVVGFIDPAGDQWVTGTGTSTNPQGDGNADQFHNGYHLDHLTLSGNRYYAERLAAGIAELVPPTS